jgi:hypothetical protein
MDYVRLDDNLAVYEDYPEEVIEVRVTYGSTDEILGYVYGNVYKDTWREFEKIAKARGGELADSVIENDDKYETFRALLNEGN